MFLGKGRRNGEREKLRKGERGVWVCVRPLLCCIVYEVNVQLLFYFILMLLQYLFLLHFYSGEKITNKNKKVVILLHPQMGVSEEEYYFIYPVGYGPFLSSLFINFQNPIKFFLSEKKKTQKNSAPKQNPQICTLYPQNTSRNPLNCIGSQYF